MPTSVSGFLEKWDTASEMSTELAEEVFHDLDSIMEEILGRVEVLAQKRSSYEAVGFLAQSISMVSAAATKQPRIVGRLARWIGKLKVSVNSLGKQTGANSISISFGFPWGVSIGLSWPVT
ncbi:MAG: hypothetical protein ABSG53_17210 [Thermoguttaceae bacterium]